MNQYLQAVILCCAVGTQVSVAGIKGFNTAFHHRVQRFKQNFVGAWNSEFERAANKSKGGIERNASFVRNGNSEESGFRQRDLFGNGGRACGRLAGITGAWLLAADVSNQRSALSRIRIGTVMLTICGIRSLQGIIHDVRSSLNNP